VRVTERAGPGCDPTSQRVRAKQYYSLASRPAAAHLRAAWLAAGSGSAKQLSNETVPLGITREWTEYATSRRNWPRADGHRHRPQLGGRRLPDDRL